jgi:hypothetical protein
MRREPSESESRGMRCKFLSSLIIHADIHRPESKQAGRVKENGQRYICDVSCGRSETFA